MPSQADKKLPSAVHLHVRPYMALHTTKKHMGSFAVKLYRPSQSIKNKSSGYIVMWPYKNKGENNSTSIPNIIRALKKGKFEPNAIKQ